RGSPPLDRPGQTSTRNPYQPPLRPRLQSVAREASSPCRAGLRRHADRRAGAGRPTAAVAGRRPDEELALGKRAISRNFIHLYRLDRYSIISLRRIMGWAGGGRIAGAGPSFSVRAGGGIVAVVPGVWYGRS